MRVLIYKDKSGQIGVRSNFATFQEIIDAKSRFEKTGSGFPFTVELIKQQINLVSKELNDTQTTLDYLKSTVPEADWDGCILNMQNELSDLINSLKFLQQTN